MIIIEPTRSLKQPFKVRYTAPGNNKTDAHTENLTSKRNCWKNIYSLSRNFLCKCGEQEVEVWDKTVDGSKPFWYTVSGIKKKAGVRK